MIQPPGDAAPAGLLAHTRLAILDLSAAGAQPMRDEEGRYVLVYNGELYNYRELAAELAFSGRTFRSSSDTEVVLAAFAEWGVEALPRFTGMFALAIADLHAGRLYLARDGFGIKPLYYTRSDAGGLAFASEIRALVPLPGVSRRANSQRLFDYLRFGVSDSGGETMFDAVQQVPAGSSIEVDIRSGTHSPPRTYWKLTPTPQSNLSLPQAAEELRERFLESIALHLRSDVPVGAALSGGIDSSAIVCAMRHVGGPGLQIETFHYTPADGGARDESHYSSLAAAACGARIHTVHAQPENLQADLEDIIVGHDQPFASTSIYAQFLVFRAAREHGLKVMLDGQGADELLAGYGHYQYARIASCLRQGRLLQAASLLRSQDGANQRLRALQTAAANFLPTSLHSAGRRMARAQEQVPPWLNHDWVAARDVVVRPPWRSHGPHYLKALLARTIDETSLPALLRYEDSNSMAHSVESRVPFLTPALAEFILSLPEHYLLEADGTSKAVFRIAMRGIVPDEVLDRRDKIGFETPEQAWLGGLAPWLDRVFSSDAAGRFLPLHVPGMQDKWAQMLAHRRPWDATPWRWLNAITWAERFSVTFD